MKFRFSIIAIIAFTLGVHNTASADFGTFQGLKFGGGFLWNDEVQSGLDATGGGFHASAEFALLNRVAFSPFYELSRRNDLNSSLFGGEFHYLIPMGGNHAYVGPGFGVADYNGRSKLHINGVLGWKYSASQWLGFFVQGKYAWAADDLVNGITAHAGITIPFLRIR